MQYELCQDKINETNCASIFCLICEKCKILSDVHGNVYSAN